MSQIRHANRDEIVAAFRASGMTRKAFCQENGVNIHNLGYWLTRSSRQNSANSGSSPWVAVQVQETTHPDTPAVQVLVGNVSVAVWPGFEPQHLLHVLRTVMSL